MKKWIFAVLVLGGVTFLHFYLRGSSPLYNFFLPPNDLYDGSIEVDFDLSKPDFETEIEVVHEYPGNHMVALKVERPARMGTFYEDAFVLEISARSDETTLLEGTFPTSENSFQGGDWGFLPLVVYSVPSDAPQGESIKFRIRVLKADPDFSGEYGNAKLYIGKFSDE